jgi:hypothetical protein
MTSRRYELSDFEWSIIEPLLPNKPRGIAPLGRIETLPARSFPQPDDLCLIGWGAFYVPSPPSPIMLHGMARPRGPRSKPRWPSIRRRRSHASASTWLLQR